MKRLASKKCVVRKMCSSPLVTYLLWAGLAWSLKLRCFICSVPVHKLNDSNDPTELKEEVKQIFDDWIRLSDESPSEESHDSFVESLQRIGFLKVCHQG